MNGQLPKIRCPSCRKELDGVILVYLPQRGWLCSKCAADQKDVLHCERGSKVKAVNLDVGWACDQELKEFPGERFNTVHFERCE